MLQNFGTPPDWTVPWPANSQIEAAPVTVELLDATSRKPCYAFIEEQPESFGGFRGFRKSQQMKIRQ